MLKRSLILFFILICALLAFSANAQVQGGDITLGINPKHPRPNQEVTATLSTYATDLDNAKISWSINGTISIVAIGKKNFSFRVSDSKNPLTIEAVIETSSGSAISKQIVVIPTDVDLLWEAPDSYVPPFYRGKALPVNEATLKVVAIPNTDQLLGFSYKWQQDANNKPNASGYGKNFYSFKNSYLDNGNVIEVTVSDLLGKAIGSGRLNLKPVNPKIIFYKKDLSLGTLWEKSLTNPYNVPEGGEIFVVEPYFFSPKDINSNDLTIDWFINGEVVQTPSAKNVLAVKQESNQSGSATIKVAIKNIKTFFQNLDKTLNVNF